EETVRVLIEAKADLNKKNSLGDTALHRAIKNGHEDIAIQLVKFGASLDQTDRQGKTAFQLAEEYQTWRVLELIEAVLHVQFGTPDVGTFTQVVLSGNVKNLNTIVSRYENIVREYEIINPLAIV